MVCTHFEPNYIPVSDTRTTTMGPLDINLIAPCFHVHQYTVIDILCSDQSRPQQPVSSPDRVVLLGRTSPHGRRASSSSPRRRALVNYHHLRFTSIHPHTTLAPLSRPPAPPIRIHSAEIIVMFMY